jgi:hypothetical protein
MQNGLNSILDNIEDNNIIPSYDKLKNFITVKFHNIVNVRP